MGADDLIGHRLVPKADMLYHVPRRRKSMKILVTENLDPWLDVRDLMYEDGRSLILGERVHGVVLGGGNPVIENNRLSSLLETLGAETIGSWEATSTARASTCCNACRQCSRAATR